MKINQQIKDTKKGCVIGWLAFNKDIKCVELNLCPFCKTKLQTLKQHQEDLKKLKEKLINKLKIHENINPKIEQEINKLFADVGVEDV